jgi:hypothetical protein
LCIYVYIYVQAQTRSRSSSTNSSNKDSEPEIHLGSPIDTKPLVSNIEGENVEEIKVIPVEESMDLSCPLNKVRDTELYYSTYYFDIAFSDDEINIEMNYDSDYDESLMMAHSMQRFVIVSFFFSY